ncbi:hypothetical protein EON65_29000 [archaeon]|nr:MAG: hypothetical protein EON65_29000 [archaeon]
MCIVLSTMHVNLALIIHTFITLWTQLNAQEFTLHASIFLKHLWQHKDRLNSAVIYDRDFNYDYFGFKTLERAYLMTLDKKIVERPQHMIMRVALGNL